MGIYTKGIDFSVEIFFFQKNVTQNESDPSQGLPYTTRFFYYITVQRRSLHVHTGGSFFEFSSGKKNILEFNVFEMSFPNQGSQGIPQLFTKIVF